MEAQQRINLVSFSSLQLVVVLVFITAKIAVKMEKNTIQYYVTMRLETDLGWLRILSVGFARRMNVIENSSFVNWLLYI